MDFFFTLVTLALSELEETHTGVMTLERNISVLCSYQSYCGQEYTQGHAQALRWRTFPPAVMLGRHSRRSL